MNFFLKNTFLNQIEHIGKGTFSMSIGLFLRALGQMIIFISIARLLNVKNFGAFAATVALAGAIACYVGAGSEVILIKKTVNNIEKFNSFYGTVLMLVILTFPFFFIIYISIAIFFLYEKVHLTILILIGISDIFFNQMSSVSVFAYQSCDRIGRAAKMVLVPTLFRAIYLIPLFIFSKMVSKNELLTVWAYLYLFASITSTIYSHYSVIKDLGRPTFNNFRNTLSFAKEGIFFSLGGSAARINSDIDKTMLAKYSTLDVTGVYSAGYRIIDVINIPLVAILKASLPKFFRKGSSGLDTVITYSKKMLPIPVCYALAVGFGFYIFIDYLPYILGDEYDSTIKIVKWLIWLPIISVFKLFSQTILGSCGHQQEAMFILLSGSAANIMLNLMLIPILGWKAAVISTYVSELLITLQMVIFLRKICD